MEILHWCSAHYPLQFILIISHRWVFGHSHIWVVAKSDGWIVWMNCPLPKCTRKDCWKLLLTRCPAILSMINCSCLMRMQHCVLNTWSGWRCGSCWSSLLMLPSATCLRDVPSPISSMTTVTQLTLMKVTLQYVSTVLICVICVGNDSMQVSKCTVICWQCCSYSWLAIACC